MSAVLPPNVRIEIAQPADVAIESTERSDHQSWGNLATFSSPAIAEPEASPLIVQAAAMPLLLPVRLPGAPLMMLSFTWTAGGSDDLWSTALNWGVGGMGYPDDATDDATFDDCGFHAEFNANRTIDDLNVDVSSDFCVSYFDANGTEYTLTCDTVTLTGLSDGVKVVEKAGIETN
ncbi:MAG: hypothetical protein IT449_12865 [Phycisphaerales bacterium]|nr:hypothetical protein [Phycisphaerales bacterium]